MLSPSDDEVQAGATEAENLELTKNQTEIGDGEIERD